MRAIIELSIVGESICLNGGIELAEHTTISVSGHLSDKRGIYQMILTWYENGARKRKSISTGLAMKGNKKRAETMLRDACSEQEDLLLLSADISTSPAMLFSDLLLEWLASVKPQLKPTTYGCYENMVKRKTVPYFLKTKLLLCKVTDSDISEFYSQLQITVKATTVFKYHNCLSGAFQYAIDKNLIEHSPMEKVKRPRAERFVAKFLKQSETIELFEAIRGHKLELGVILAAYYGLRRGEIVGLRWESINFEQNTLTIEHTVTVAQVDGKKTIIESDTAKTKSSLRTLPLMLEFRNVLLALQEEQERNKKLCGNSYNKREGKYIYVDLLGNRIRPDYLTAEFPLWLELNGFKRLRFHDLRHSCASLLLANGVPLKQIQDWLGHSSFKITADAYAHLDYDSKINAANAMTWIKKTSLGGSEPEAAMFAIEEDDPEAILKQRIKDLLGNEIDNRILQSLIDEGFR